jgi:hypothetical protein
MQKHRWRNWFVMKLRKLISEYAGWIRAIDIAKDRGFIDILDCWKKLEQLRDYVRAWIGEDLLNREL